MNNMISQAMNEPMQKISDSLNRTSGTGAADGSKTEDDPRLRKVAQEFEAIFLNYIMKNMRNTVPKSELMGDGKDMEFFTGLMDTEVSRQASQGRGTGLSDTIYQQLARRHGTLESLPDLKSHAALPVIPNQVGAGMQAPVARPDGLSVDQRIKRFEAIIEQAAHEFGLDPALISSMIAQESGGRPNAVSAKGAKGLMQLMDGTAREMGVRNVFDPGENIHGGVRYMKQLMDRYDNNLELALASYNAGPAAVDRYQGIPPYKETQQYVARILNRLQAGSGTE